MRLFLENFIQPGLRLSSYYGHMNVTVLARLDEPCLAWLYDNKIEDAIICLVEVHVEIEDNQIVRGDGEWSKFYVVGGFRLERGIGEREIPRTSHLLLPWFGQHYWHEDIGPATKQFERCSSDEHYNHPLDFATVVEPLSITESRDEISTRAGALYSRWEPV